MSYRNTAAKLFEAMEAECREREHLRVNNRVKMKKTPGSKARERLRRELEERARRDACPAHRFVRVESEPPSWYCPKCNSPVGLDYMRGFVSGLIAAEAEPSAFVADYGTWP